MLFPTIKPPRDQAIMDIIFDQNLGPTDITKINRCRIHLQAIFLSDITTADGTYLEHFVFDPGRATAWSRYTFPREQPSCRNWDQWINFWNKYSSTRGKLKIPLEGWINPTHMIWHWYYNKERDELYHLSGTKIKYFKEASGWQRTRSMTTYKLTHAETSAKISTTGIPTSVIRISDTKMNKLHKGPPPLATTEDRKPFWNFIATWGGSWMWRDINNVDKPKDDIQWIAEGMTAGTLVWTTDRSYDRKRATD